MRTPAPPRPDRTDDHDPSVAAAPRVAAGVFRPHPRGFGFVDLDEAQMPDTSHGEPLHSVFVPPPTARGLLDGDRVRVDYELDDRGATATRVQLAQRRRWMVSVFASRDRRGRRVAALAAQLGAGNVVVAGDAAAVVEGADDDAVAVLELDDDVVAARGAPPRLRASRVVAGPASAGTPAAMRMLAAARVFGDVDAGDAPERADGAALRRAAAAAAGGGPLDTDAGAPSGEGARPPGAALRRDDRTDQPTVTVDDPHSGDLDDALSARRDGDGWRVDVHIADVAAHVAPGSPDDARAAALATSLYLADEVVPMLPPSLSEDALSLRPDVERDALTASLRVDADGAVALTHLAPSRIRSDRRLSYRDVAERLAGSAALPKRERRVVDAAAEAAAALGRARDERATLERLFADPTRSVVTDGDGARAADPPGYDDARRVIERLMVAANEAVAGWLVSRGRDALFRVHPGVAEDHAEVLDAAAARAGAPLAGHDAASIAAACDAADDRGERMLSAAAASALTRAGYAPKPAHHYGLDTEPYCHFTSPLRRYADLVVHRAVRAELAGEASPHDGELDALAVWVSDQSGRAARGEALERAGLWGVALAGELGDREWFAARVTRLSPAGASVRVDELGVGGFVPAAVLAGTARLDVDDDGLATVDDGVEVGDELAVAVDDVDEVGRVTFTLAAREVRGGWRQPPRVA